jgi:hypothetical protein
MRKEITVPVLQEIKKKFGGTYFSVKHENEDVGVILEELIDELLPKTDKDKGSVSIRHNSLNNRYYIVRKGDKPKHLYSDGSEYLHSDGSWHLSTRTDNMGVCAYFSSVRDAASVCAKYGYYYVDVASKNLGVDSDSCLS